MTITDYSAARPPLGLTDALTYRAEAASNLRLALDVSAGLLAAVAALLWRPAGWLLITSAAICFSAFGSWGFSRRLLRLPPTVEKRALFAAFLVLRTISVTVGFLAALVLLFGVAGIAMGTWIS